MKMDDVKIYCKRHIEKNISDLKISIKWRQIGVTLLANLLTIPLGVIFSWSIAKFPIMLILRMQYGDGFIVKDCIDHIVSNEIAFLRVLPFLLIVTLLPLIAYISERFGRKMALVVSTIPFALFSLLIAGAQDHLWIIVAMNFGALACALQFYLVPIYICEISNRNCSEAHGVVRSMFTAIGFCLGFFNAGVWMKPIHGIISLVLIIVFLISLHMLPESPVWLARKNRNVEAERALAWLRIDDELPIQTDAMKFTEMFQSPEIRKELGKAIVLFIGQAVLQINCLGAYFLATVKTEIWTGNRTRIILIHTTIYTIICIITSLVIDRIGRRVLLITSCIGMLLSIEFMPGLWMIFRKVSDENLNLFRPTIAVLATIYSAFHLLGIGTLPCIIAVEIIPKNIVSYAYAISTAIFWIFTWIIGEFWQAMDWPTRVTSWIFLQAIVCLLLWAFVYHFLSNSQVNSSLPPRNLIKKTKV